jgi:hypothetical protein
MRRLAALLIAVLSACGSDARPTSGTGSSAETPPAPQTEAERTAAEARDARAKVEQLQRDLTALDARLSTAVTAVVDAQTDAARADAKARVELLQRDRAQVELQLAQAKRAVCVADPAVCK